MEGRDYRRFVEEERRLVVLRVTAAGKGVANDLLLHNILNRAWAIPTTRDELKATLEWLSGQGYVECSELHEAPQSLVRVGVTGLGKEVADGVRDVAGVTPRSQHLT